MKNILLIVLLLTASNVRSQDSDPTKGKFMRLKNPYTFDFAAFDLSIQLPANTGFRLPYWSINNSFFESDTKNVVYHYDSKTAGKNVSFKYTLSDHETADLILLFDNYSEDKLEDLKKAAEPSPNIPDIKSKIGTFKVLYGTHNRKKTQKYFLVKDDLLITFTILARTPTTIAKCQKIIASLQFKDLSEKEDKYLKMTAAGYFISKTPEFYLDDVMDTTLAETTFSFPAFGLKMTYPKNWKTFIRGTDRIIIKTENTTKINWSLQNINYQGMLFFQAKGKNMHVMARFIKKWPNIKDQKIGFEHREILKQFPIVIDGISTLATLTGEKDEGELHFMLYLKSYDMSFSIYHIHLDEIPLLEALISGIHLTEEEKVGLPSASSNIKSLGKQLDLRP